MKEILLSFKDDYYEPLLYGLKKYEYRKRFCAEEVKAYLYLSGKTKKVIGILKLGKPIRLDKTRDDYISHPKTLERVDEYIEDGTINAVPIESLSLFVTPLSLSDLRKVLPGFMPPQMYYRLENNPRLAAILHDQKVNRPLFIHNHDHIYHDNLAVSIKAMKESDEFKRITKEKKTEM